MATPACIVWLRRDLRLEDQPAVAAAARQGAVVPVFIWAPDEEEPWPPGAASRWWLHQSLAHLQQELERHGSKLIIRRGPSLETLNRLIQETGARAVYWNRGYEPAVRRRDDEVNAALHAAGIETQNFKDALLFEPHEVLTRQGGPYRVFTPFYRACLAGDAPPSPKSAPRSLPAPQNWPESASLESLGLEPRIDWAGGLRAAWTPGAAGAKARLKRFLDQGLNDYPTGRDIPGEQGVSGLSPHLHFGEISPRQVWHAVRKRGEAQTGRGLSDAGQSYLRQIVWREFAYHLLVHFPLVTDQPLNADFARFPWLEDPDALRAWQRGRTGYPLVDAGMRELWSTGWMHNRARMIAASLLVKHLLIPWQAGARWFWDTLVDADLANNTLGWQWVAGCGADAAPYFRIFNPVTQGERFDGDGAYVRRWVPELSALENEWLQKPWEAPRLALDEAGIELGRDYPWPIIEHAAGRTRALEALAEMRGSAPKTSRPSKRSKR
jgi:deoxyribodipyrimidine photo-lyase